MELSLTALIKQSDLLSCLVEGGIGAQAKALERLGADFEHYKLSEWEVHATASYHKIHMKNDTTSISIHRSIIHIIVPG